MGFVVQWLPGCHLLNVSIRYSDTFPNSTFIRTILFQTDDGWYVDTRVGNVGPFSDR